MARQHYWATSKSLRKVSLPSANNRSQNAGGLPYCHRLSAPPSPCRASINKLLSAALQFVASQAPLLAGRLQPALFAAPLNSRLEQLAVRILLWCALEPGVGAMNGGCLAVALQMRDDSGCERATNTDICSSNILQLRSRCLQQSGLEDEAWHCMWDPVQAGLEAIAIELVRAEVSMLRPHAVP